MSQLSMLSLSWLSNSSFPSPGLAVLAFSISVLIKACWLGDDMLRFHHACAAARVLCYETLLSHTLELR